MGGSDHVDDHSPTAIESHTRTWLDAQLRQGVQRSFDQPQSLFDSEGHPHGLSPYHFHLLQRKLKIIRLLDRLEFASFVDVGAGFETYPRLVRERYGVSVLYADFNHQANLPLDGFPADRLDRAVTAGVTRLPFPDGAFDVVLCSEVLEHLVRPIEALAELMRVARRAVVLTSLEALAPHALRRRWLHFRVDITVPHVERNFFSMRELTALLGADCYFENLIDSTTLPAPVTEPPAIQDEAFARVSTKDALIDALCRAATPVRPLAHAAAGVLAVKRINDQRPLSVTTAADREIAAWLVTRTAAHEQERLATMERYSRLMQSIASRDPGLSREALEAAALARLGPPRDRPVAAALLPLLCCPDCRRPFEARPPGLACSGCASTFPAEYGVPVLLPRREPEATRLAAETVERLGGGDARRRRIVTRIMRRLRRNEKPAGALRRGVWSAVARAARLRRG